MLLYNCKFVAQYHDSRENNRPHGRFNGNEPDGTQPNRAQVIFPDWSKAVYLTAETHGMDQKSKIVPVNYP